MSVVALIGLGNMGQPMARRLLAAGHEVHGFDLAEDARARLEAAGGRAFASPGDAAAAASAVILMLPNSDIVEAVVGSPDVSAALRPGTLVVDMSSSEPLRTRALATTLAERGLRFIDAPVSGGVKGAEKGSLMVMVGGSEEDIAEALPILEAFGTVRVAGPVGAGHAAKALNNLMSATHLLVSSEAILAGKDFGVEPELLLQIVNGSSGRSGSTENKWPNFILPGTYDSGFAFALMLKDMKIAVSLADHLHSSARLSHAAFELWSEAAIALPEDADHTEIARWVAAASSRDDGPAA